MRKSSVGGSVLCAIGACLLLAGVAESKETKMTMSSLPAAVRKTAMEQTKGDSVLGIIKEIDEGKTVYELETKRGGRTRDILIAPDGTLLMTEEQVDLAELPPAVKATFEKSTGKGKLLTVEGVHTRGALAYYEAQIKTGKKISEVKVGLDGKRMN